MLAACLGVMGIALGFAFFRLPAEIPLVYANPWGEAQLADSWYLAAFPLFAIGTTSAYIAGKTYLFPQDKTLITIAGVFTGMILVGITGLLVRLLILVTL